MSRPVNTFVIPHENGLAADDVRWPQREGTAGGQGEVVGKVGAYGFIWTSP